jgi:hypothetical protein
LQTCYLNSECFIGFESADDCRPTAGKAYRCMAICWEARYNCLLNLPEAADVDAKINAAMCS